MAKNTERKLFLFGRYSLALLLPKKWLNDIGAKIGDSVHLKFEKSRKRLVISFGQEPIEPKTEAPTQKTTEDEDDLKPIPTL